MDSVNWKIYTLIDVENYTFRNIITYKILLMLLFVNNSYALHTINSMKCLVFIRSLLSGYFIVNFVVFNNVFVNFNSEPINCATVVLRRKGVCLPAFQPQRNCSILLY